MSYAGASTARAQGVGRLWRCAGAAAVRPDWTQVCSYCLSDLGKVLMTLQPGSPICVSCHHWGPSVGSRGPKGIIPGGVLLIGAQWWDLGYSAIVSILSPLRCSCIILELSVTPVHKITLLRPALFPGAAFVFGACLCAWELTARLPCFAAGRPVSIYSFPEAHLCASRKPSSQLHARLLFTALAPLELANISQRQFLFLGDTEQIRNSPRIFQRALRRSSEIGSGGGGI